MSGVHYFERGEGPALVCLHGIGSSSASFNAQSELTSAHRIVAWDAPGYGSSQDPTTPLTLSDYADAVAQLVVSLGASSVHLLGVSWGGVIACQVALDHPQLLRSLTLIGASRGSGRSGDAAAAMRSRVDELARCGVEAFAASRAPRLVSPAAPSQLIDEIRLNMVRSVRVTGYTQAAAVMATTDLSDRLAAIKAPTLILAGDADTVTGVPEARELAARIPDSTMVSVHSAGHLANQERPEAVNAWIASFLQIVDHLRDSPPRKGEPTLV